IVVSIKGTLNAKPLLKAERTSLAFKNRAPSAGAHSGIWILPARKNVRSSIIETPLRGLRARSTRTLWVSNAHAITASAGSASYGYQIAPAAAEVFCCPIASAKIDTENLRSAKTTPQVKPDTPAPTMATDGGMPLIVGQALRLPNQTAATAQRLRFRARTGVRLGLPFATANAISRSATKRLSKSFSILRRRNRADAAAWATCLTIGPSGWVGCFKA